MADPMTATNDAVLMTDPLPWRRMYGMTCLQHRYTEVRLTSCTRRQASIPVVTVTPFTDEAEAVSIANDTPYGLSGSIWTSDVGRAIRVARAVESGNLSVNSHSSVRYWTPFGGFKQSGLGRELGPDAPDAFTETKNVFIATEA